MTKTETATNTSKYNCIHTWLRYHHGSATHCEGLECTNKKATMFHYALIKGKQHEKVRDSYLMLCTSCHKKYDMTDETRKKMSESQKGRVLSQETRDKISRRHKETGYRKKPVYQIDPRTRGVIKLWDSSADASDGLDTQRTGICNVTKGNAHTCGGYYWQLKEDYDKR